MRTRRFFLKSLLGLGAVILPWTGFPQQMAKALEGMFNGFSAKLSLPPPASPPDTIVAGDEEKENLYRSALEDIIVLTGPEMQGREAGTAGEIKAAEYLTGQMRALGLQPKGDDGAGFAQAFTIPAVHKIVVSNRLTFTLGNDDSLRTPSANLLGVLPGATEETVILSAHYDHLGIYQGQIYPGANDNASGVACVLDVIRRLLREEIKLRRTLLIGFWGAEESGYNGSKAFISRPVLPLSQIKAVLNVDTVGNGVTGDFLLWGKNENVAVQAVRQAADLAGCSAVLTPNSAHNSDQLSFAQAGIPAVTLLTRDWLRNNHTPQDVVDSLSLEQMAKASEIIYEAIRALDQEE
ncbi:MAG: M20/M25/M40 family metallo-hydrolase [Peptococcaceae bacterium]|jgi:hypothetical protein|nr:M20/M25/M40 family metallo-hydrolase [Peptococcaceae bacterium]